VLCGISNPVEGCGDFINFDDPSGKPKAKPNMADPANHEPDGGTCAENGGTGCNQAPKITHISKPAIWLCARGRHLSYLPSDLPSVSPLISPRSPLWSPLWSPLGLPLISPLSA